MTNPPHHEGLNPEQYEAVTTLEGPLLILAGAGSGKTRVLTCRIAELMRTGVPPQNILAVTFTNKAASEMKERVIELVGEVGRKVWVSTFHSTCGRILRADIEALGYTRRFSIYDDDDQVRILRQILKDMGLDSKQYPPNKILRRIDRYKNRLLSPKQVLQQHRSSINDPFYRVWLQYEASLKAADAVDFNDLILLVVRLYTEHPPILEKWRSTFKYILVDEYQDTNHAQYRLLELLASQHRNLAVVGDDDQSIYSFRGADIDNILGFERDYPEAKVIRMERNYRSSNNILALANAVVAVNTERIEKKLWTDAEPGPLVNFMEATTPDSEADQVARGILQLHRQGVAFGDIAIIYRTNATTRIFERSMREFNIPYVPVGGRKFYEHREIRDALAYLRLIVNPADDAALLRIINVPTRGIGVRTVARIREAAEERGQSLLKTARSLSTGATKYAKAIARFVKLIDHLALAARSMHPPQLVAHMLRETGTLDDLEQEAGLSSDDSSSHTRLTKEVLDARRRIANLQLLMREAQGVEEEESKLPIDLLQEWLDAMCLVGQTDNLPETGQVALMTVHNSKGLEYPVVFVTQMMEGLFPHTRSIDSKSGIEEERRLAYVAFTRAQERLIITWSQTAVFWAAGAMQGKRQAVPSRFLRGIPKSVCVSNPFTHSDASHPEYPTDPARVRKQALKSFMRHRRSSAPPPVPAPTTLHTLIDLEDPSQLQPGVRILHPQRGLGVVQELKGQGLALRVMVSFGDRPPTSVPLRGAAIQLVVD